MKVAVLADIHGNLEAFEEVSADLQQQGAEPGQCEGRFGEHGTANQEGQYEAGAGHDRDGGVAQGDGDRQQHITATVRRQVPAVLAQPTQWCLALFGQHLFHVRMARAGLFRRWLVTTRQMPTSK